MTKRRSMTQRHATQLGFAFHDDAIGQDARGLGWYGDDMWRPGSCPMAEALAHFTSVKRGIAIWADAEARWGVGEIATRAILVHVDGEAAARDVAEYAISLRDADNPMMPTPIEDIRRLVRRHAERLGVACVPPSTPAPTDERIASESMTDRAGAPLPLLDLSSLIAQPTVVPSVAVPTPSEDVANRAEEPASMPGPAPRMDLSAATDARVAPVAPVAPVIDPRASALVAPPPPPPPPAVEAVPEVDVLTGNNYYISDVRPLATSWRERARGNIAAIKLWKAITAEGRVATPDEQEILITYVGWGASDLANRMFPMAATGHRDDEWEALAAELRAVLTPEEYADASRSTQYAHYTPEVVIARVWQGIERLGFTGGAVLEPGVGTGLFIGMTPEHMRAGTRYTGVEYDRVTAGIATLLYPEAAILRADFARTALPPMYDLAVGNPPYSDVVVTSDPRYKKMRLRLHDYFFAKAVDTLRPGGLLAFVTSCGTLDKGNDTARQYLAARADLVAAIRLPRGVFAKTAGTDTAVGLVFLRKRGAGATPDSIPWANLAEIPSLVAGSKTVEVNEYFDAHPEMVLGTHAVAIGPHGPAYTVDPIPGRDLDAALTEAIERLPRDIYTPPALVPAPSASSGMAMVPPASSGMAMVPPATTAPETGRCREGNYLVADDGALMQIVDGFAQPVRIKHKGSGEGMYRSHAQTVAALVPIRDAVRDILRAQVAGGDGAEAQRRLHRAYDRFVLSHGPINLTVYPASSDAREEADDADQKGSPRTPNLSPFLDDPDAYLVSSIEIYNEETGEARKGPIFSQRVVAPPSPPQIVSSHDALSVVLDEMGRVDTARIAELMAWPEEAVVADLDDSIFLDPDTGRWETSDAYLSGAVRTKLQLAEAAARIDPRLRRNAEALARVQPPDLKPSDITARLGAPWVPTTVVEAFAEEVLGGSTTIAHTAATGTWTVVGYSFRGSAAGTSEWGTERRHAGVLLEDALNARLPNIYDTIRNDDGSTREELNVEATEAAREKLAKIKSSFQDWIWRDADRAMGLVRLYNDGYNNLAPRHFDGSHLTLPGASLAFGLYEHQKRAIWRILTSGSTYLAHAVGAGKCQPLDAKVLTPTGWRRMGELCGGDRVIAGDGTATTVVGVFPQGEKDIYRVTFSDGSSTECCNEHLWLTQTYAERTATHNETLLSKDWPSAKPKVRALAEIRQSLRDPRLGTKNHSIPMVGAVAFAGRPVPIDPYLLGVLLGDGSLSRGSVMVTTADAELLAHIAPLLPDGVGIVPSTMEGKCPSYRLSCGLGNRCNPLRAALNELGLGGVTSETKFIPEAYLFNTIEARHALLQGLLDTDGACSRRGHSVYFYTVSLALADGVVHLVQSLGGTVRRRLKHPRYTHDGERRMGKPCHVLCMSLPPTVAPFRLSRKARLVRPKTSYKPTRYIVSVEPVGRKEARCIAVAHPTHLYVTDDFIVTHNTLSVIAAIMEQKRLGLITKPIVVVPGHTLKQWAREWMALYPDANILVADEAQFHKSRRRRFLARAATGVWDGIVITHSANSFIPVPAWFEERMVDDQIAEFEALRAEVDPSDRVTRKQLERQLEGMRAKIDALQSRKDDLVDLAELGVDQIVVDECFPYDTPILTDRGWLPIGRVVEERLPVSVLSCDRGRGRLEWTPIVRWLPRGPREDLVRVVHELGSFVCTGKHKIAVEGDGYVEAHELRPGTVLCALREASAPDQPPEAHVLRYNLPGSGVATSHEGDLRGVRRHVPGQVSERRPAAKVLHAGVRARRARRRAEEGCCNGVSRLRKGTNDQEPGAEEGCAATLLPHESQECGAGREGEVCRTYLPALGQAEGARQSQGRRMDAREQSDAEPVYEGQSVRVDVGTDILGAGGQWDDDGAPAPVSEHPRFADGARGCDRCGDKGMLELAACVQGRHRRSGAETRDRGRRAYASPAKVDVSRSEEDGGLVRTRVVRVEVYERGGDDRAVGVRGDGEPVYDIEVADNHNFFASGILVSNCQEFRKLSYGTNMGSIKGIDAEGSQRSWDLYVKSRYVLAEKNPTRGLILASGTPVTNTLGEVFTIQRYMQEGALRERDLHNFDAWAAMFGEVRAELELQPSGKYKSVARFAEFTNVPELIQMVRSFMDVLMPSDLRDVVAVPRVRGGRREIVRCPATDAFKDYQGTLAARITAIEARTGKPRKGDDIILSVINDGRHAAIDLRLVEPDHPNEPGNKINACIDNIARIWEETAGVRYRRPDGTLYEAPGAAQMVFSDLGTPAAEAKRGFSVYHWIRDELVARGIPASHIAFMQTFKKSEQKVKLFEAVNAGVVRVLIGSTQTMGTGVNAQTRLRALHHIDCPWLPSNLEQREGRIIRQKNQHEEVEIYAYATLGSLDAAMWQTLERKAKFIEAVLKGDTSIRRVEDVGESQSNQFAMAKALASGDERLLTKAGLTGDLARLRRLKAAHFDDQVAIRGHLADAEVTIRQAARRITAIEADLARREETRGDKFYMEVAGATHDERRSAGAALIASVERHVGERYHGVARLGRVAGFDLYFRGAAGVTATRYGYELYLERTDYEQPIDIRVDTGELGAIARLENALSGFDKNLAHYEMERAQAERRLADFHPRLGQPFEFDRELTEKEAELAALDAELTREECGDEASSAPDGGAVHTPTDPTGAGAGEGEVSTPNDDASEHQAA